MSIRPIRSDRDHEAAVARVESLMSAKPGTPEFDELDVLGTLVDEYERAHHPIDPPNPIEAIKFRMDQGQLTRAELSELLGGRSKATEVLKKQRQLSKVMIVRLHQRYGIPFESLLGDVIKRATPRRGTARARARPEGAVRRRASAS